MTENVQASSQAQQAAIAAQQAKQLQQTQPIQSMQNLQGQANNVYSNSVFNPGAYNTQVVNNSMNGLYGSLMMTGDLSSPVASINSQSETQKWLTSLMSNIKFDFSGIDFNQYANNTMPSFGNLVGDVNAGTPTGVNNQSGNNANANVESTKQAFNPATLTAEHKLIMSELLEQGIKCTGNLEKDKAALDKANKTSSAKEQEAADICKALYSSMKGIGTKNDKLKEAVSKINKDNILEVMKAWDENFSSDMKGETLIESIANENYLGYFNKNQNSLTTHIQKAMTERASSLGLKSEAAAFDAKVTTENNAWFNTKDKVISDNFKDIYSKAVQAEAKKKEKQVFIAKNSQIGE